MRDFNEFMDSIDLGMIAYEARQKAIHNADERADETSWDSFVLEGTITYSIVEILKRYHDWLSK